MPATLSSVYAGDLCVGGVALLLPFIAVPTFTTVSSLNDQYSCSSYCTSGLIDGQPQNI